MKGKKPRLGTDPLKEPLDWIKDSREGKPSKQSLQSKQSLTSREGLPQGWTRATFIMRENHLEKIKTLAYWERKQIKEIVDEALSSYLKDKRIKGRVKE